MLINDFITLLEQYKVIIPPIQRDYAQGRNSNDVKRIRRRFLGKLSEILADGYEGSPLKLDFIYGSVTEDESESGNKELVFKPLDGQQRLTTLFLIHWYAAVTEDTMAPEVREKLSRFSYATRAKSRKFCSKLVHYTPEKGAESIRSQIENQPWFFLSWASDPTVSSMLVMLDAIETTFMESRIAGVWGKLTGDEPRIIFHLLPMEKLGLPDDLYIKMNSRGKELTEFEHFKSQFARIIPSDMRDQFKSRIDKQWSDLFWNIFKESEESDLAKFVDRGFLNFYRYITDIIILKGGISLDDEYWLNVAQEVYKDPLNVQFLFRCLDTFCAQQKISPAYFSELFYVSQADFETDKVRLFFYNSQMDLFNKCAEHYSPDKRNNPFSIGEQLMLYACILDLQNSCDHTPSNLRKIRNLIAASEDQLRKEYLSSFYLDIEAIISNREIPEKSRFSKHQILEESNKAALLLASPKLGPVLNELEDHHLLRGTLSIFKLSPDIAPYAEAFEEAFPEGQDCDYSTISRAMMLIGDYSQDYGKGWRRIGNHAPPTWRELFTVSDKRKGFSDTRAVLYDYLRMFIEDSEASNASILGAYKPTCFDWRYYYIHYDNFCAWNSRATEGYYYWTDCAARPFEFWMMYKKQFRGRHWNPYLLEISTHSDRYSLENYGGRLQITFGEIVFWVSMDNDSFRFETDEDDPESILALAEVTSAGLLGEDGCQKLDMVTYREDTKDRITVILDLLQKIEVFLTSNTETGND